MHGVAGRLYDDASPLSRHPIFRRIFTKILGIAETITQAAVIDLVARPEFMAKGERFKSLGLLPSLLPIVARVPVNFFFVNTAGTISKVNKISAAYVDDTKAALSAPSQSLDQ